MTPRGPLRSFIKLGVLALGGLTLAACGKGAGPSAAPNKGVIRFSILGSGRTTRADWRPILADMADRTGLKVVPSYSGDESALAEAMRRGKTDAGWFSNPSGLRAARLAHGEVFARVVATDEDSALLVVNSRSHVTLAKILACDRRLRLGLGDPRSASGGLAVLTYLFAPRDIDPKKCFRQVRVASPAANLSAVAHGRLDVASGDSLALPRDPEAARIAVIWRSPPLPEDPILWRRDLDPAAKEKLRQFFLTYGQGEGSDARRQRADLAKLGAVGFLPADDDHLLPTREMDAAETWLLAKEAGDTIRTAAARKALDNIRAQREALEGRTRAPAAAQ